MTPDVKVALVFFAACAAWLLYGLCRGAAARRRPVPPIAAPAPDHNPAQEQARAICNVKSHIIPNWAHHDGMWFCARGCGYTAPRHPRDEVPFDRVKAEEIAQLEQLWRVS